VDIATIIGIIAGLGMIFLTIITGQGAKMFLHVPSILIVVGGSVAATLVSFPLKQVTGVISVVRKAFFSDVDNPVELIDTIVNLSKKARKEGLLAIDSAVNELEDPFLRTGMQMVVDGTEPDLIRGVMEIELSYTMERHKTGQQIFNALGTYAPAFGMIGTLMGLIQMLSKLDDPSKIGGGMAVALITTFYGAVTANLIFLPIAGKLKNNSESEVVRKEMIVEGVLSIQYGEHPNTIHRKLSNFLAPKLRVEQEE
jgi:chemotaxis protein MotA